MIIIHNISKRMRLNLLYFLVPHLFVSLCVCKSENYGKSTLTLILCCLGSCQYFSFAHNVTNHNPLRQSAETALMVMVMTAACLGFVESWRE